MEAEYKGTTTQIPTTGRRNATHETQKIARTLKNAQLRVDESCVFEYPKTEKLANHAYKYKSAAQHLSGKYIVVTRKNVLYVKRIL